MGMCTSIPNSSDAGLMPERYQFYQNPCYPVVIIKRQEGVDHDVPKRGFRSHRAIPPSGRQSGVHTAGASPQAAEKTAGPVPLSGHVLRTDDGVHPAGQRFRRRTGYIGTGRAAAAPDRAGGVIAGQEPDIPASPGEESDWRLTLVNPWNALPEGFTVELKELSNGHAVDERCYPDLQDMLDACREAGLSPLICSSYRSYEKQKSLYQNKIDRLRTQGYSAKEAQEEAGKAVAAPGTSEHQLGLAVDIVDVSNQNLDNSQEQTAVQKWLMKHSWEYGFILRYPNDKSEITGIIYEPWHYRYVGKEAAAEIQAQGVCLEEYLEMAD